MQEEEEEEEEDVAGGTSGKATSSAKKRKTAVARVGKKGGMKPPKISTTNAAVRDFSQGLKLLKDKFLLGKLRAYCHSASYVSTFGFNLQGRDGTCRWAR